MPTAATAPRPLSKSQYTRGLQCHRSLWLYRRRKDLQYPISPSQQAIFDNGTAVGVLAQKWVKGGVLIEADHTDPEAALDQTVTALQKGATVLYEAAFRRDGVLIRADIIARNNDGGWDLYEVKSTTEIKEVFLDDVAIQRYVLEGSGLKFDRFHVVHLNPGYLRYGALDLDKLFLAVDVTAETAEKLAQVPGELAQMKEVAALEQEPEVAIGPHCSKPYDCDFEGHCWAKVPDYSVFNLAGARKDKTTRLWNSGIKTVDAIPDYDKKDKDTEDFKLTDYQLVQRKVAKTGERHINREGIKQLLQGLSYPQYFLDFEAVNPAVPPYNLTRPYQQIPFEASLHIRRRRGGSVDHKEYLCDGTKDGRQELAEFLEGTIGPNGSVIAYSKSYEGGIMKGLVQVKIATERLLAVEQRLWDLADIFRKAYWAEPAMLGSWSIKKVLPALVPTMSYAGMAIADGVAAMQAYARLMSEELTPEERTKIMADLRLYCGQDTLAMVMILDRVESEVGVPA